MRSWKRLLVAATAVLLAVLCACAGPQDGTAPTPADEDGFPPADMSGYAGLEGYEGELVFYELTVADIAQLMERGESFAFIAAFADCPWCNLCIAQLNDAALAEGVQVGYLNTRRDPSWSSNIDIDDYDLFVELFGDYLEDDAEGIPHLYTPHVFFIRDGEVVYEHSSTVEGVSDPSQPLSEQQSDELVGIYRDGFALISES